MNAAVSAGVLFGGSRPGRKNRFVQVRFRQDVITFSRNRLNFLFWMLMPDDFSAHSTAKTYG